MINKITNWTIGSFFRTIGRIVAYAIIGFLIFLFASGKVGATTITASISGGNYNITLPNNCYDFYIGSNSWGDFLYCSDNANYVVMNPQNNSIINWYTYFYKTRHQISQSLYNHWVDYKVNGGDNPLYDNDLGAGVGYYDNIDNKYYAFFQSENGTGYRITYNGTSETTLTYNGNPPYTDINIIATSINYYGYNNSSWQEHQLMYNANYNLVGHNVTFVVNGGYVDESPTIGPPQRITTNFTRSFLSENYLKNYVQQNLDVEKTGMVFLGWCSDINLTTYYNFDNILINDITLYAKFAFVDVNSVVNNITFRDYTFTGNNKFAIINNTTTNNAYIGLQYNFNNIDVFKYNINTGTFITQSYLTLNSMGTVDDWYYYNTELSSLNNELEYIIIDKSQLSVLANGVYVDLSNFRVSTNATVTFYENLNDIQLEDYNGNTYNGNASQVYYNHQNEIISNNSDVITIFREIAKNKNNTVFGTFGSLWTKFKGTPIFNYFYIILIGTFIIFVLKVASRK